MNELLIVDEEDHIIGYGEKSQLHAEGVLHRAFSIFIYHEHTKQLLLQKRALCKYHSGGLWSNSCCSHPYRDEAETDGYQRCMKDELGIELPTCELLKAGSFIYYSDYGKNMEHEYDHVVLLIVKSCELPVFSPNMNEVEELRWASVEDIKKEFARDSKRFSSWFCEAFRLCVNLLESRYLSPETDAPKPSALDRDAILNKALLGAKDTDVPGAIEYSPAFDQGKTGYCWLIAALYCMSRNDPEQNNAGYSKDWLMFWDKIERVNHFLNFIVSTIDRPLNDAEVSYFLRQPVTDHGHWNMAENLIRKYGVRPYDGERDMSLTRSFRTLNAALSMALRMGAYELRRLYDRTHSYPDVLSKKKQIMEQSKQMIADLWGNDDEVILFSEARPERVDPDSLSMFDRSISVSCGYGKPCTPYLIRCDGNVEEGRPNSFLELSPRQFHDAVDLQIKNHGFCPCSCDASKFFDRETGYCGDEAYDLSAYLNMQLYRSLLPDERIDFHFTNASHMIVLLESPSIASKGLYLAYDSTVGNSGKCIRRIESGWKERYISAAVIDKKTVFEDMHLQCETHVEPWEFFALMGDQNANDG